MIRLNRHLPRRGHPSPISSQPERELKLVVAPDFHLPRLPGTPLPRRQLISTYYDTTAYDLAHAKMTLRHRIERGKKSWQLKIPLGDDRQEIEVRGDQVDPPASLLGLLTLHLDHRKLVPVVTLRVWRRGFLVRPAEYPSLRSPSTPCQSTRTAVRTSAFANSKSNNGMATRPHFVSSNSSCEKQVHPIMTDGPSSFAPSPFQPPPHLFPLSLRRQWSNT